MSALHSVLDDAVGHAMRSLAQQEETMVQDALRVRFGYQARVTIRKPRWMPERVYRWLMRTIVIEATPVRDLSG